jgi:hypothetical protein
MATGKRPVALKVVGTVVGLVVLVSAGWLAWVKQASAPSAALQATLQTLASRPCAGLQVVGVRGHSDPSTEVGPDVRALIQLLKARLGQDNQTDVVSLPYEQGPNLGIVPLWVPRDITNGARTLEDYLRVRMAACRGEPRVVIAQSEGAGLAHLAFPHTAQWVQATVLLGDPLHLSSAAYDENLGATSNGSLVPWMGMGIDVGRRTWADPVPSGVASRIRSYCLPHDHVCSQDFFDRQHSAHLEYRNNPLVAGFHQGVLDLAVDFVVARLGPRTATA